MFAETDWFTIIVTGVVSLIGGGAAGAATVILAYVAYLKQYYPAREREQKQRAEDSAADREYRKDEFDKAIQVYADDNQRLRDEISRKEEVITRLTVALEAQQRENSDYREALVEVRTAIRALYKIAQANHDALKEMGRDPGPLPDLPPMQDRFGATTANLLTAQAAQAVLAEKEASAKSKLPEPNHERPAGGK